ncbi:ATP-grasp domain-containing protein [Candidatus Methylospira mobilis]|uniref:ATP-grasp domain-containing protein n=1 Tax=Candidatus Methylospira mobilis TaxID=1808979 RepID=UPI0028EFF9D7|nr:ATP-grasp domain-containing protein [Candidatus Methylospira mobilis]WNV06110.1 ATP-grasp domain-containing protein [Candidatus Methylospira mobilis]
MMARSLARAGIRANAIDRFGDADLCAYLNRHVRLDLNEEQALQQTVDLLAPPGCGHGLIIGSGVDMYPQRVRRFAEGRTLLGNSPEILAQINTPSAFFELLDRLSIAYPETSCLPPVNADGWLFKRGCSEGGKGVAFCAPKHLAPTDNRAPNISYGYFQRYIPGEAMSALFLAHAGRAQVFGFNTLWCETTPDTPFLFAGAVSCADLTHAQRDQVCDYIERIVAACALVGLNSLDFVLDQGRVRVLELNPRPSATLMLYDELLPEGLMWMHIQACRGNVAQAWAKDGRVRAFRIVYAPRAMIVPFGFSWPAWCFDRPDAGARIAGNEPLCTITTQHTVLKISDAASAAILLEQRALALLASLGDCSCAIN